MRIFANYSAEYVNEGKSCCLAGFMEPVYWDAAQSKWVGIFSGGATTFARVVPVMLSEATYLNMMMETVCVDARPLLHLASQMQVYELAPDLSAHGIHGFDITKIVSN